MLTEPTREEINHRTIKLIVGLVAISLATLTSAFATSSITSISASYYEGGWAQTVFIGFLFAIAALLLAYNGLSSTEMLLSKVASGAALGVALFPCECKGHPLLISYPPMIPYLHGISAAVMFLILVFFCYAFYLRARQKHYPQANVRAVIYVVCGVAILASIILLAADRLFHNALSQSIPRLVFYGEATGLVAFGVSWLTASRTLPLVTRKDERFSPLRKSNPL